jgi:uncharacterized membrane protein YozB (DUF420 family)
MKLETSEYVLLFYIIIMLPAMLVGFFFARRKMFVPNHKLTMTAIVIVNWLVIIFYMSRKYAEILPDLSANLSQPPFLIPTIHMLLGGSAQILGTILVLRMWFEKRLPKFLRFEPIKPWMRLTLALWLLTILFGVLVYLTWYHDLFKTQ